MKYDHNVPALCAVLAPLSYHSYGLDIHAARSVRGWCLEQVRRPTSLRRVAIAIAAGFMADMIFCMHPFFQLGERHLPYERITNRSRTCTPRKETQMQKLIGIVDRSNICLHTLNRRRRLS